MHNPAISIQHVSKQFRLPNHSVNTVRERVRMFKRKTSYHTFTALNDISFEIAHGEFVGIIGHNGSGKSTLLKIIAGILEPTTGKIVTDGSISPFLELGVGFHDELSARRTCI